MNNLQKIYRKVLTIRQVGCSIITVRGTEKSQKGYVMNIVKKIKGYEIDEREHRGNKYYVIHDGCGGWNKAHSLEETIELVHVIDR